MPGREWPGPDNTTTEPIDDHAPRRRRELMAALAWLPVAALILADDGTVLAANQAWDDLAGAAPVGSNDQGQRGDWLSAVWPTDAAALRVRLLAAATDGGAGSADVRLAGEGRAQWSRWWWRAGPRGYLIVCAGESGGPAVSRKTAEPERGAGRVGREAGSANGSPGPAADAETIADTLGLVVHRLFGIGLGLQSVTSRADDVTAQRLQHILDELDELIGDVRSAAFSLGRPVHR